MTQSTATCTLKGWPNYLKKVLRIAQHFWSTWDELSIEDGILLKADHICIPPELFDRTLADLHNPHQGDKEVAAISQRSSILAPALPQTLLTMLEDAHCAPDTSPPCQSSPCCPQEIPDGLWQDITADHFNDKAKDYLLICILFSKYPFLYKITTKSAQFLIQKIQELIAQYRPPGNLLC